MSCPNSITHDRTFYGLVLILGLMWTFASSGGTGHVIRRPYWATASMLKFTFAHYTHAQVVALLVSCWLAISPSAAEVMWFRLIFALAVSALSLVDYSRLNIHTGFILLYTAWAMVTPEGMNRRAILLVVSCHQLISSGVQKLRVGGILWFTPETMRQILAQSQSTSFVKMPDYVTKVQSWVLKQLLARPLTCAAMGFAGCVLELVLIPAAIYLPHFRWVAFSLASGFHVGVFLLQNIVFPYNLPCYFIAVPSQDCEVSFTAGSLAVALLLSLTTVFSVEDWPFNHIGLFTFNHLQVSQLVGLMGRICLLPPRPTTTGKSNLSAQGYKPPVCLVTEAVSSFPSVYHPAVCDALGITMSTTFATCHSGNINIDEMAKRLQDWLGKRQPFLDTESFAPVCDLLVDGKPCIRSAAALCGGPFRDM